VEIDMQTLNSTNMQKQKGLTMISWIVVIAFLGFQGILAMNVIPVYLNDNSVRSIMESLQTDPDLRGANAKKIRETISKRLRINNLYDIKKDNITIRKDRGGYKVTIMYEPRGTLVGNLDYIITFSHEGVVPAK
jgi:hypothetical protein